jgi:hypothetical protein
MLLVQLLSCVCDIMSIFIRELRELAHMLHCISDCVFYTLMGWYVTTNVYSFYTNSFNSLCDLCTEWSMAAQVNYEIDHQTQLYHNGVSSGSTSYAPVAQVATVRGIICILNYDIMRSGLYSYFYYFLWLACRRIWHRESILLILS